MTRPAMLEDKVVVHADEEPPKRTVRLEPTARRVRAYVNGVAIADSKRVMVLFETSRLPVYYVPAEDVRMDCLEPASRTSDSPLKGAATHWNIRVGERLVADAAWRYGDPPVGGPDLRDFVAFYWQKMDAWYEEDDEVFVHPRDPYHRVDVLNSSRHVRVIVGGEVLAETRRPRLVFETGLPTRYYIPRQDVRLDRLVPSETVTQCPYKGKTVHFSIQAADRLLPDMAWSYPFPIAECPKIENLICFYDERVDAIEVDGEVMPKPRTPWS